MLTALILVCSLATSPDLRGCTRDNALDVLQVPETFASPVTCLMRGQAYLANTAAGRDPGPNEAVKVVCVRGTPAGSTTPRPVTDVCSDSSIAIHRLADVSGRSCYSSNAFI
jgi:hypothetical protein